MLKSVLGLVVALSFVGTASANTSPEASVPLRPDPQYTQGDYCQKNDHDFEEVRYKEKVAICMRDVSWETKVEVYAAYKVPLHCRKFYTVDHYIPLSMGGSNQFQNLWPEHKDIKATRQNLEQEMYEQLADGKVTRDQAVQAVTYAKQHPPTVIPRECL